MQLPRLELHNTFALLGISQRRATIEMRQPKAEMKFNQPQPEVKMSKSKSKLEIDQTEAFADANLKHPIRMVNEWVARAKQKAMQSIASEASEGDRLMKIEHQSGSVIPQIAKEESETPPKEFNIGFVPESTAKVKFRYQPSEIKMKVNMQNLKTDVKTHSPIINYNRGDIQIYLKQKASLQIQAVGVTHDQKI